MLPFRVLRLGSASLHGRGEEVLEATRCLPRISLQVQQSERGYRFHNLHGH